MTETLPGITDRSSMGSMGMQSRTQSHKMRGFFTANTGCSVLHCVAVFGVLQCVAVRSRVLLCVAVRRSALQCVAVCLQCVAVCLHCIAVCLQCVAVSCSVFAVCLQCVYRVLQCVALWYALKIAIVKNPRLYICRCIIYMYLINIHLCLMYIYVHCACTTGKTRITKHKCGNVFGSTPNVWACFMVRI